MGVDLQVKPVPIAIGGINKNIDSASLRGLYTPYMKNMFIEKGKLRKFRGYEKLVSINNCLTPINGSAVGKELVDFIDSRGESRFFAFTSESIFYFNSYVQQWNCKSPGGVLDQITPGWTGYHSSFTVDPFGGILIITADETVSDDNLIAYKNFSSIDISSYTHISGWIRTNVSSLGGNLTLVISESADGAKTGNYVEVSIPDPGAANTDRFFNVSVDLSSLAAAVSLGLYNNSDISWEDNDRVEIRDTQANTIFSIPPTKFEYAIATDTDMFSGNGGSALVITNDQNDLMYSEGVSNFRTLVHTFPSFSHCRDIEEFWNHFFLVNYNNGYKNVKSLAYSGAGDIDDYVSDSSGSYTLFDTVGKIKRAVKVGYNLVIFSDFSITIGSYLGTITKFLFQTVNNNLGLLEDKALCLVGDTVFFIGSDRRFYQYIIGSRPVEIGRPVSDDLTYSHSAKVFYDNTTRRVWFRIGDNQYYLYNLNTDEKPWEYLELNDDICSLVQFSGDLDTYELFPGTSVMLSETDSKMFVLNEPTTGVNAYTMAGVDIPCEYQTEDISINDEYNYARWQEFTFSAKSAIADASVTVQYSVDNGDSWNNINDGTIYLETDEWKTYTVHFDVVSRVIRIRFTQTSKDLQIKDDMFIGYLPELVDEVEVE